MGQRGNEIDTAGAARLLEVSTDTLRRWAQKRIDGEPARIKYARVDLVGRYWFDRDEIVQLHEEAERGPVEHA